MSINSIAARLVAAANDLLEEAGFYTRYGIIQDRAESVEAEPELPFDDVPEHDFHLGAVVDITNVKDGNIEHLVGTIVDECLADNEGEYDSRAITEDGRKFKGPIKDGETRKGTRFDLARVSD